MPSHTHIYNYSHVRGPHFFSTGHAIKSHTLITCRYTHTQHKSLTLLKCGKVIKQYNLVVQCDYTNILYSFSRL